MANLASVADLASVLQLDPATIDNARATLVLGAASAAVRGHTRQVHELVANETVRLAGNETGMLDLPERPVTAVSAVLLNGSALVVNSGWHWPGSGWLLRGPPSGNGPETIPTGSWGGPASTVTVTYSHGFAVIPDPIRQACLSVAARLWANPAAVRSEGIGTYNVTYGGAAPAELSHGETIMLRRYTRPVSIGVA